MKGKVIFANLLTLLTFVIILFELNQTVFRSQLVATVTYAVIFAFILLLQRTSFHVTNIMLGGIMLVNAAILYQYSISLWLIPLSVFLVYSFVGSVFAILQKPEPVLPEPIVVSQPIKSKKAVKKTAKRATRKKQTKKTVKKATRKKQARKSIAKKTSKKTTKTTRKNPKRKAAKKVAKRVKKAAKKTVRRRTRR